MYDVCIRSSDKNLNLQPDCYERGLPMPLILKPDPTDKTPNHFIVLCDGVLVGRIFDRVPGASAPRNATWWICFRAQCGFSKSFILRISKGTGLWTIEW
jgi:hypothetical protein